VDLARELITQRILVNTVAPGSPHTDIPATAGAPNRPARVVARIPMGRLSEPAEVAEAILWLLSAPPPTPPARSCASPAVSDRAG